MADAEQLGFDMGEPARDASVPFRPEDIRADMTALLAEARAVTEPDQWSDRVLRYKAIAFPLLAKWLPEEEAAQLCFEFAREVERIELLKAA